MMPALAGCMTGHCAVQDLDLAAGARAGAGVPGIFEYRFESILGVDSPAGADRVTDQRHADRSRGLFLRVFSIAHSLGVGAPLEAEAGCGFVLSEHDLAEVIHSNDER